MGEGEGKKGREGKEGKGTVDSGLSILHHVPFFAHSLLFCWVGDNMAFRKVMADTTTTKKKKKKKDSEKRTRTGRKKKKKKKPQKCHRITNTPSLHIPLPLNRLPYNSSCSRTPLIFELVQRSIGFQKGLNQNIMQVCLSFPSLLFLRGEEG